MYLGTGTVTPGAAAISTGTLLRDGTVKLDLSTFIAEDSGIKLHSVVSEIRSLKR